MKYIVSVAGRQFEVERDGDHVSAGGRGIGARIDSVGAPATEHYVLRIGDAVHRVQARRTGSRGQYDISIDGYRIGVEALDERARAIRELSRSADRPSGPAKLIAPMPGLVVRVHVSDGDAVSAGQGLVVIEAMKMENELKAAAAGVVRRVLVKPGNAVEKGTLLLEMEASHASG